MIPALSLAILHTGLFRNCLDGMDDEAARRRIDGRTNNAAFVAAHLVMSRAWTLGLIGVEVPSSFGGRLVYGTSLDDLAELPLLAEIRAEWESVSAALEGRLAALMTAELAMPSPRSFPVDDPTVAGTLAFLLHHEAYHIGQLSLLRRMAGLPAMRYR